MTKIILATPVLDGKLDIYYVDSLMKTTRVGLEIGIDVCPIFIAHDALIQRARNDLFKMALESGIETTIFIDADMTWEAKDFFRLSSYKEDIVAGIGRKKSDVVSFAFSSKTKLKIDSSNGLIPVDGVGCAFLKMSRKAMLDIWNVSAPYKEDSGKENRMIFSVDINEKGLLVSEDIALARACGRLGYTIWVDPNITLGHIGQKVYKGTLLEWAYENKLIIE
jgi:hypothetical protein